MDDPYVLLGVARDATADQIKKAYRKLARELHPDLHPNDKKAEDKFKQIGSAYDVLSDPKTRARFDAGEIDGTGAERPRRQYRQAAGGPEMGDPFGGGGGGGMDDLWSEILRRRSRGGRSRFPFEVEEDEFPGRGADSQYQLHLTLPEAALGGTKRITLPGGRSLDVKVKQASLDGTVLRLKGQGVPGTRGGAAGDILIEIKVDPHPVFVREGDDVVVTLPVTLPEAVLGGKVTVPTLDGAVTMTVPAGSNSGTVLRLKGKGIPRGSGRGDERVTLQVVLPEQPDEELETFLRKWSAAHPYDVREKAKA